MQRTAVALEAPLVRRYSQYSNTADRRHPHGEILALRPAVNHRRHQRILPALIMDMTARHEVGRRPNDLVHRLELVCRKSLGNLFQDFLYGRQWQNIVGTSP